jgi:two-component system sensor histidine kinase UhpB
VQEALANITKHAHATTADVSVTVGENIRCVIRDNGKGFDVATHSQGHGRRNIDYRVKMLGGTATCESALGIGTTLTIEIPHSSKEKKS